MSKIDLEKIRKKVREVLDKRPDLDQFNAYQAAIGIQMLDLANVKHPIILQFVEEWRKDKLHNQ